MIEIGPVELSTCRLDALSTFAIVVVLIFFNCFLTIVKSYNELFKRYNQLSVLYRKNQNLTGQKKKPVLLFNKTKCSDSSPKKYSKATEFLWKLIKG